MNIIYLIIASSIHCIAHHVSIDKSLSRQTTTVLFTTNNNTYESNETVGGEQINTTRIEAKKNESYSIEVDPSNDSLDFFIEGSSLNITQTNNPNIKIVTTVAQTKIMISFLAHPASCHYKLKIQKL